MAGIKVGLIGLGRMGLAIAHRLENAHVQVIGFDADDEACKAASAQGIHCVSSVQDVCNQARIVWIMVPAGKPVDDVLNLLTDGIKPGDILIDGGNSFYKDSMRRAQQLEQYNVSLLDCGTSGGLHGKEVGFSLMVGGSHDAFQKVEPLLKVIAAPSGYVLVGPSGAGHFVKMVHNGIEYALLQAYAEGFQVLKQGPFENLNLEQIASVWNHGSIIRSWILELAQSVFTRDQNFDGISGVIGENLTGRWTVDVAKEHNVDVKLIQDALDIRAWSRESGGNYATKLVALLRHEFGGHSYKKVKDD